MNSAEPEDKEAKIESTCTVPDHKCMNPPCQTIVAKIEPTCKPCWRIIPAAERRAVVKARNKLLTCSKHERQAAASEHTRAMHRAVSYLVAAARVEHKPPTSTEAEWIKANEQE